MTLAQFCALTGKSKGTVSNWIRLGKLDAIMTAGRYMITEEEYQRFLREGLRDPSKEEPQSPAEQDPTGVT